VTASTSAVNGSYTLEVKNIATAQYLTSAKIDADSTSTKLTSIDSSLENKEVTITANGSTSTFTITSSTTINDFTTALKNAGLNASYDTTQKRFFISSKESGLSNAFSITTTAVSQDELDGQTALRTAVGYDSMSSANKAVVDSAMKTLRTAAVDSDEYNAALDSLSKASYDTKNAAAQSAATTYAKAKYYSDNYGTYKTAAESDADLKAQYYDENGDLLEGKTDEDYEAAVAKKADEDTVAAMSTWLSGDVGKKAVSDAAISGMTEAEILGTTDSPNLTEAAVNKYYSGGVSGFSGMGVAKEGTSPVEYDAVTQDTIKEDIEQAVRSYASITDRSDSLEDVAGNSVSALSSLGLADVVISDTGAITTVGAATTSNSDDGMAFIAASDSKVLLNGAVLTSSSSTVSANGLSIALTSLTKDNPVTFTVSNDVDSVYNTIKSFLKDYNAVMKEMYTAYNADSASDYSPLTSEQKEAMSDDEVEEWETKIKDSLLRRDSTLDSVMSSMRSAMMSSVTVNGKNYSLSSFGIMTSTDYTEGGLLHIYGDSDDSVYSSYDDKLKAALQDNPEDTAEALAGIFANLRSTMFDKMKAVANTSSTLTFYNDISMKNDISDYESEISDWEDKLADMEDAYYSKFTAMETALAKLQSQSSSVSSLFGS
jgi:flagellar hook-associated protein 2